jgi:hypothetical protein
MNDEERGQERDILSGIPTDKCISVARLRRYWLHECSIGQVEVVISGLLSWIPSTLVIISSKARGKL